MTEWVESIPPEPPPESSFRVGLCHQHTDEFPPLENATKSLENSSRNTPTATVIIPKIEGKTNANNDVEESQENTIKCLEEETRTIEEETRKILQEEPPHQEESRKWREHYFCHQEHIQIDGNQPKIEN